ncbi:MAG: hypothetical protein OXC68_09090 [Aestuariivita sp.]|nr:hypothetical protein [Aestuariivita sp.]
MNTQLAKNESAIDRLRADMEKRDKEAMNRDKDAIQREKENQRWIVGLVLGATILIIAVLGLLIRWPVPPV